MKKLLIGSAMALALTSTTLAAAPIHAQGHDAGFATANGAQVWLAQGNSGKGKKIKKGKGNAGKGKPGKGNANAHAGHGKAKPGKGDDHAGKGKGNAHAGNGTAKPGKGDDHAGKGKGKPDHAGGPKPKAKGKDVGHASNGTGKGARDRRAFDTAERDEVVSRIVSTPAPAGRDMARIIGATALAWATPRMVVSEVPDDELIAYRNCPPGLAKKDPPCVPPGLAKKGVTYDEWASYEEDEYDEIWVERRDDWLGSDRDLDPDPDLLLLQSDQIATLFDLEPAPDGKRYALIDGLPVLLDEEDYTSLLLVNQMARVPGLADGVPIAPTAALTQDELIRLYRLPQLGADENYAVLNGQLVQLDNSEYEILQLIRIARSVL